MSKTVSKKSLILYLAISLVVILVGAILFGVFGFNADSTVKDYTVIEVSDSGYMSLQDKFRTDLDDLCKAEIEKSGLKIKEDSYIESTSVGGILSYTVTGEGAEAFVSELQTAIDNAQIDGVQDASVIVTYHEVENAPHYEYIWRTAIGAAVVLVILFVYVAIRFNVGMGVTSFVAALHDVIVTLAIVALLRIPAGVGLIGVAAITLLLSAFLNLMVFGKMRKDFRLEERKGMPARDAVALSVKESTKTILTAIVLLAAFVVVFGVIGVIIGFDMASFMLGMLMALVVTTYSSLFLSPAIYAAIKERSDANRAEKAKYNYDSEKKRQKEAKTAERTAKEVKTTDEA